MPDEAAVSAARAALRAALKPYRKFSHRSLDLSLDLGGVLDQLCELAEPVADCPCQLIQRACAAHGQPDPRVSAEQFGVLPCSRRAATKPTSERTSAAFDRWLNIALASNRYDDRLPYGGPATRPRLTQTYSCAHYGPAYSLRSQ